ncbi:MAG: DNA topoisomerase VI subunit B [Candidatus Hadarchaeales archaeon]
MKTLAEELFKDFREHSVSEFFRKNAAMLGYTGKIRSLTTVVHEGVTNAIDAAEEAGIPPDLTVAIRRVDEDPEHLKVVIEDNASGIPEEFIPHVFGKMLAGTKLHRNMQSRGQQGIGIVGAVMFGQITSGRPAKVVTSTGNGEIVCADVMIDVDKNEGRVMNGKKLKGNWRGTKVELELKEVKYERSRYGPYNYLRMTAIANPHARITFIEPDGKLTVFERATDEVPERPKPMSPHPWGVTADDLLALAKRTKSRTISSFLISELSRMTKRKAEEARKLSGVNFNKRPSELTWEEAERLVSAFKQIKFMAPPTSGLRPIGAANIENGMRQIQRSTVAAYPSSSRRASPTGAARVGRKVAMRWRRKA